MPKIAAAYIRVSTEEQAEYSPASQLRQIQRYAQSHNMTVPKEFCYVDEGISGRQAQKRPAFMRMIARAKQKPAPFEAILVYSLSRFARNREDSIVYKTMLRKELHIDLISVTQDLGSDKSSILLEALLEAMDEYYSVDLAENVKRGMAERLSRGEPVSAPPYGYQMRQGRLEEQKQEAETVRWLFTHYAAGASYRELSQQLNAAGCKTKRGNPWQPRAVAYVLHNPVYVGSMRRKINGGWELIPGSHQPLVDKALWQRAQKGGQASTRRIYEKRENPFILQGLLRCGTCGSPMVRAARGRLQCGAYAHGRCTVSHSVAEQRVIHLMVALLSTALGDCLTIAPPALPQAETWEQKQAHILKSRKDRLQEAFLAGYIPLQDFVYKSREISQAIWQLQKKQTDQSGIQGEQMVKLTLADCLHQEPRLMQSLIKEITEQICFLRKEGVVIAQLRDISQ